MLQISPLVIDDRKNSHQKIKYTYNIKFPPNVSQYPETVGANHRSVFRSRDLAGPIRAKSLPEPELMLGAECTFGNVLICPCHLGKLLL